MEGVYLNKSHQSIVATLKLLKHFRTFLQSKCDFMIDPYSDWHRDKLDKEQAQRKLIWLINMAINRKAGIPDYLGRKDSDDYQRNLKHDYWSLVNKLTKRITIRSFNLPEMNKRFGHLLYVEEYESDGLIHVDFK